MQCNLFCNHFVHSFATGGGKPIPVQPLMSTLGIASVASDVSTKLLMLLKMQWDKEDAAN